MALTKFTIPIVLIIFKRPETTKKVLQILSQIKPDKLFVIADGPRSNQAGENLLCEETRQLIETEVNWDCQVFTNYSPDNLGCRQRVISGLNWVFSQVEQAIILEDDCLPDLTFFPFCAELLPKYADANNVMVIAGDNFQLRDYQSNYQNNYSYYFSLYPHCWGWATWRRAWQKLDEQLTNWPQLRQKNWLKEKLTNPSAIQYWSKIFQNVYEGFNSWAYIWHYSCWLQGGLTILPATNLVSNIGFSQSATHTTDINSPFANLPTQPLNFPLQHPPHIIRNIEADNYTENILFSGKNQQVTPLEQVINKIFVLLNNYQYQPVVDLANKALNVAPRHLGLHYGKALALARIGQKQSAIKTLNNLLNIAPNYTLAHLLKTEIELPDQENIHRLITQARQALEKGENQQAFDLLHQAKAFKQPMENLDYWRAIYFLKEKSIDAAISCLHAELQYFPDNAIARSLLGKIFDHYPQYKTKQINDPEFQEIYEIIRPYTMLGEKRLYSLFSLAKRVCENNIPGNIVECGVAGGGSTALMATMIQRYSQQPRYLYAFDSFEGMPPPTIEDQDLHGVAADATGWGTGTCASPESSVINLCTKLGLAEIVKPVKGYFADTLPQMRQQIRTIALLHADSDWYESTKTIFHNFYDQMAEHGIIQIDDYGHWEGCRRAVEEFQRERQLQFDLQKIDYSGVWFICPDRLSP